MSTGLPRPASFAAMLAASGLPDYDYAPRFCVEVHGATLAHLSPARGRRRDPPALAKTGAPLAWYAAIFAMAVLLARRAMAVEWSSRGDGAPVSGLDAVLRDGPARRLLLIVLVDATPVAVTATLFLVHMADHLRAPGGGRARCFCSFCCRPPSPRRIGVEPRRGVPAAPNGAEALWMLSLFHAGVPPGLKAVAPLLFTRKDDDDA